MFKLMRKSNFGHLTGKDAYWVESFGSYQEAAEALKTISSNTNHVYFVERIEDKTLDDSWKKGLTSYRLDPILSM